MPWAFGRATRKTDSMSALSLGGALPILPIRRRISEKNTESKRLLRMKRSMLHQDSDIRLKKTLPQIEKPDDLQLIANLVRILHA